MKKLRSKQRSGCLALALLFSACSEQTGPDLLCRSTGCRIVDLRIDAPSPNLLKDRTLQLTATLRDESGAVRTAPLTWRSSSEAVATVSNSGVVTGVGVGTAEITAATGSLQRSFAVHVVERPTSCSQTGTSAPSTISDTTTWRIADGPIHVAQDINITGMLIIDPGTLVCFAAGAGITLVRDAFASLFAQGGVGDTIVFTAANPSQPWLGIRGEFVREIDLRYVRIEHAIGGVGVNYGKLTVADARISNIVGTAISESNTAATIARVHIDSADHGIDLDHGDVTIRQVTVQNGGRAGLEAFRAQFSLQDVTIDNIRDTGVILNLQLTLRSASNVKVTRSGLGVSVGTLGLTLTGFTVANNRGDGVSVSSSGVAIHNCNFFGNGGVGVRNSTSAAFGPVDATMNWWGDPAGPLGPAGDGVEGLVTFMPVLTQPALTATLAIIERARATARN